jgi:hypothetical protein
VSLKRFIQDLSFWFGRYESPDMNTEKISIKNSKRFLYFRHGYIFVLLVFE